MNSADIRKVKKLAHRLGTRDSDIIRFAVKSMLAKLLPLYDGDARGRNLVPVFVESGSELVRFFELDVSRLEAIINDGAETARCVARDDITLIAMRGAAEPYAALKLNELSAADGTNSSGGVPSLESLRHYLYEKYVYRSQSDCGVNGAKPARNGEEPRVNGKESQHVR
ncbi:MAG TPA: hypothetical protein VFS58_07750 [Steroidobacteraceae bacterium]|nr:hypothetical protein [Steroidobacteraceae bacterium]